MVRGGHESLQSTQGRKDNEDLVRKRSWLSKKGPTRKRREWRKGVLSEEKKRQKKTAKKTDSTAG